MINSADNKISQDLALVRKKEITNILPNAFEKSPGQVQPPSEITWPLRPCAVVNKVVDELSCDKIVMCSRKFNYGSLRMKSSKMQNNSLNF